LARRERILEIIETEVSQLKTTYATPRRTVIEPAEGEFDDADLIANEKSSDFADRAGLHKRMPVNTFEAQVATRKAAARVKEDDGIEHFLTCCDHDSVLFFSDRGVVLPQAYQTQLLHGPVGCADCMLPIPRDEKLPRLSQSASLLEMNIW